MITLKSRFFKLRDPKKFGYTPRYYDQRKEKLDELVRKHENTQGKDPEQLRREINFRQSMSNRWQSKSTNMRESRTRMTRLMILLAGLVVIALYSIRKLGLWEEFF